MNANVLVSALVGNKAGPSARILRALRAGEFTAITSRALLTELSRVLAYSRVARRLHPDSEQPRAFIADLTARCRMIVPSEHTAHLSRCR